MAGSIDVNAATTTALLNAFETAKEDQQMASSAVNNAASALRSGWSGEAATAFVNSIGRWLDGLEVVRNAMITLQDNMAAFARSNTRTEDDVLADASTWMNGQDFQATWT